MQAYFPGRNAGAASVPTSEEISMSAMQAVVKTARGEGQVDLREVPVPAPGPGQVLLAVRAAGICGTDLHIYHDEYATQPPVVLGHELAGEVAATGAGVTTFAPGDRVTTETYFHLCGQCRFCRGGQPNLCPERRSIGSGVNGGFAPYVVVPERNLHRLPESLTFQEAALTEPLACVVHGALELPKVTAGDVAVVAGPGAIGLLTLQAVRAAGAAVVMLGTPVDTRRLELARELGAMRVIDVTRGGPGTGDSGTDRRLGSGHRPGVLWRGGRRSGSVVSRATRRAIRADRTLWQAGGLGSRSGLPEGAARHRQQRLGPLGLADGLTPAGERQRAHRSFDLRRLFAARVVRCVPAL